MAKRRLDLLRVFPVNKETPVGVRLAGFAQSWQNLQNEWWSSKILYSGVQVDGESQTPQTGTPKPFPTRNRKEELQEAVDNLLKKGAIEPIHRSSFLGFFSRLFQTGDLHLVIDLSTLNRHFVIPHFQMETAETSRAAIWVKEWAVSIGICDAYFHFPMSAVGKWSG